MKEVDQWFSSFNQNATVISKTKDSAISFKEKGEQIIFENPNREVCYCARVDGGLIKTGKRCDWLLVTTTKGDTYYVELKGVSVFDAFEQLYSTISNLFWSFNCKRVAIVVGKNRYPLTLPSIQSQIKRFGNSKVQLLVLNSVAKYNLLTGKCCQKV